MTKGHYFNDNCYIVMWSDNETIIVNLKKIICTIQSQRDNQGEKNENIREL